jgi:hypothetical protein
MSSSSQCVRHVDRRIDVDALVVANDVVNALCEVLHVAGVETGHRDAAVVEQVDVVRLLQLLLE